MFDPENFPSLLEKALDWLEATGFTVAVSTYKIHRHFLGFGGNGRLKALARMLPHCQGICADRELCGRGAQRPCSARWLTRWSLRQISLPFVI